MSRSSSFTVFGLLVLASSAACSGQAPAYRVPPATIVIPKAASTSFAEPTITARAGRTLDVEVTLGASDPRRNMTVWIAENGYRAAHDDLCAQLDTTPKDFAFDDTTPSEDLVTWHEEKSKELRKSCSPGSAFVRTSVELAGSGESISDGRRRFRVSVPWIGRIPLGGATIEALTWSARLGDAADEAPSDVREQSLVAPLVLEPSMWHPNHAPFAAASVLLPDGDGRYVHGEEIEDHYYPLARGMQLGWHEATVLTSEKDGVTVLGYRGTLVVHWASHTATIDLAELGRHGVESVSLLDVTTRGDRTWALLQTSTMSRGYVSGGYCGLGTEGDWTLLELGEGIEKSTSESIESCLRNVISDSRSPENAPIRVLERSTISSDPQGNVDTKKDCVRFDRAHPERGISSGPCTKR